MEPVREFLIILALFWQTPNGPAISQIQFADWAGCIQARQVMQVEGLQAFCVPARQKCNNDGTQCVYDRDMVLAQRERIKE